MIDYGLVKPITSPSLPKEDSLSIVDGRPVGVGTPKYTAPEQFAGGNITPATLLKPPRWSGAILI